MITSHSAQTQLQMLKKDCGSDRMVPKETASKHFKKHSTSLDNSEMQIETTVSIQVTPVRMANMRNTSDYKFWYRNDRKGMLIHCWWQCKIVGQFWK